MARYVLSPAARQDLAEIRAYLGKDSAEAARRVLAEIRDVIRLIAERPGLGHRRDDLTDKPVMFKLAGSYHVIYRPDARPIEVARVLHVRRDLGALLEE